MVGEAYQTCLNVALKFLEELLNDPPYDFPNLKSPFETMILDLRFFKMLFWMLAYWEESEYDWHLCFAISTMLPKLSQIVMEFKEDSERAWDRDQRINWEEMSCDLEKIIKQFKPQVKEICILILGRAFKCKSCQHNQELFLEYGEETTSFINFILQNLNALLNSDVDLSTLVKQQITFIQWKLKEFGNFVTPVNYSITKVKILRGLLSCTRTWANHISCLACLYWVDGNDDSLASTMGTMLSNLMHKTMPYTPGIVASYVEGTMISQLLASYFDFLLKNLVIPMKDDVEILHEGLVFLSSFVMDPPEEDLEDRELILAQIYAIINELPSLICSIRSDEMKKGISKATFSSFLQKIIRVKAEIRELYVMSPRSSQLNSPKTNPIGFLDSLLRTLKKMLEVKVNIIPSIKHQIEIVQEELVFLRTFLHVSIGLQNKHGEFKDLWTRIIDVVYYAAYVTNLCHSRSFSMWYGIVGLQNVIEDIKLIKAEFQKIEDHEMYKNKILYIEMESSTAPRATTSKMEGAIIGFKEDAKLIIDYLIRGQNNLLIISISGLPGQGKTTLAKRIYNDRQIQHHFHKIVWCYVSKECKARELLIKIGRDLIGVDVTGLEFDTLAESLRKKLKQKRYLIVMDDIWDVVLWRQVQISFPDDSNGSRILFTSRNHDLASQAKPNSISHHLRLFSNEESWELMKEKLFSGFSEAPIEFLNKAQQIASHCKGLPLAIALIGSLLQRAERKLELWNKILENLKSHLADEGCGHIIEQSYKYLPDHLKSCFLYFGAFSRGENVRAKKLKRLWIAEGFIKDNQCLEDLANEYLDDLVSQNLVVVSERSSMGEIKKCNVHDLLYDLCLEKANEENFLHWAEKSLVVDQCNYNPQKYNHHRIWIGTVDPFIKPRPICTRKELPTSQVHSLLWVGHHGNPFLDPTYEFDTYFLKSFKVLTVLDLDGMYLKCDSFPEVILSIIELRYLALHFRDEIPGIPPSIADLWNLETLIVRAWGFNDPLPISIWKMKSLRYVDLPVARLHLEDIEKDNSFTASNIEMLVCICLVYDSKTEEFLKKFPRLRKLVCKFDDEEYHPMWFSMFGSLEKLESLRISGHTDWSYLYEKNPIFNFFENLKKLSLWQLKLPWSAISAIGKQVPNLQVLKLLGAIMGSRWILEDGDFSNLRYLKLYFLDIEEIDVSGCEDNPFPYLEQLIVEYCFDLKEISSSFGEIYTLKTITMIENSCEADESVSQILEEQRDMGNNDLQVFIKGRFDSETSELESPNSI